jgi:hypothetical protein
MNNIADYVELLGKKEEDLINENPNYYKLKIP